MEQEGIEPVGQGRGGGIGPADNFLAKRGDRIVPRRHQAVFPAGHFAFQLVARGPDFGELGIAEPVVRRVMCGEEIQRFEQWCIPANDPCLRKRLTASQQPATHGHGQDIGQPVSGGEIVAAHRKLQFDNALFDQRLRRNHRHAKPLGEAREFNAQAFRLGDVDHVERHDHRQTQFDDLAHQIEVTFEVRCIHHANDPVRTRRAASPPEQDVAHHRFVR